MKVNKFLPRAYSVRFVDENNETLTYVTLFKDGDVILTTYKDGAIVRVSPDSVIMNCDKNTSIKASEI